MKFSFPGRAFTVAVAVSALSMAPAQAKELKPPPGGAPETLSTASQATCDKRFAEFDTNRDGRLSYEEFADGRFGMIRFAVAPSDAEVRGFIARYMRLARAADSNRDGWLTLLEHRAQCQSNVGP